MARYRAESDQMCFPCFTYFCVFLFGPLDEKKCWRNKCFCVFHLKCIYICICAWRQHNRIWYNNKSLVRFQVAPLRFLWVVVFFLQPNKDIRMAHVFCVFLCFSSRQTLVHNYQCVSRVFVFFFQTNFRSQPMCFACFFVINKYLSSTSSQGRHPMCFVCFCVFLANRSQAITHVFYEFLWFF